MKKKRVIAASVLAAAGVIAGFFIYRQVSGGAAASESGKPAYVSSVSEWMGSSLGTYGNRFAGIVESQETWSVSQIADSTIKETFVSAGDAVEEGDPLFEYDVTQYEADLSQAEIDLERLNNELDSLDNTISTLESEKKKASSSEQADYTIRIEDANLQKKQKELDIRSKEIDIEKLNENIENATVVSGLTGVVKSVGTDSTGETNAYITVMQTGELRVKGSVNEQNIGELYEGAAVIVHSRVNREESWKGTITSIDRDNKETNESYYYGNTDSSSSSYPFYVTLEESGDLMLGQHVYVELDFGQDSEEGLRLYDYLIDVTDETHPFVWADDGSGKLVKKEVTLGDYNEETMEYVVLDGITETDLIAFPEEDLTEGMRTEDYANYVYEENEYTDDTAEGGEGLYLDDGTAGVTEEEAEP